MFIPEYLRGVFDLQMYWELNATQRYQCLQLDNTTSIPWNLSPNTKSYSSSSSSAWPWCLPTRVIKSSNLPEQRLKYQCETISKHFQALFSSTLAMGYSWRPHLPFTSFLQKSPAGWWWPWPCCSGLTVSSFSCSGSVLHLSVHRKLCVCVCVCFAGTVTVGQFSFSCLPSHPEQEQTSQASPPAHLLGKDPCCQPHSLWGMPVLPKSAHGGTLQLVHWPVFLLKT